jgi:hypothetical protein
MRLWGFYGHSASLILEALKKDILNKSIPVSVKLWAWRRGFTGSRVYTYGINESNYRNHMPDFDYYKLHPINGSYSKWIDDKLTMKYILTPFNEFLPRYYFQVEGREIFRLMDCPGDIKSDVDGIIDLLKRDGNLALKPLLGSLGTGFYRLTYENTVFYVNTKEISINELRELIKNLDGYLVTEYIIAHEEIRKIYDVTPNTVRIQLTRDKHKKPKVTGSFMRFGTKISGVLESPTAGGMFVKVDIADGKVSDAYTFSNGLLNKVDFHPDTNQSLTFTVPFWEDMLAKVCQISEYLPQLNWLGFDIIVTNTRFKIIEINSLTATTVLSFYYPFLEDEYCKGFFKRKFNENPKYFKNILKVLEN